MRGTSLVGSLVFSVMMSFWFLKVGRTSSPYPKSDFHRGGQRLRRASSSRLAGYGTPCGVGNCFKQLLAARSHTAADGCAKQASLSVPAGRFVRRRGCGFWDPSRCVFVGFREAGPGTCRATAKGHAKAAGNAVGQAGDQGPHQASQGRGRPSPRFASGLLG
jgi:hypothetical protein